MNRGLLYPVNFLVEVEKDKIDICINKEDFAIGYAIQLHQKILRFHESHVVLEVDIREEHTFEENGTIFTDVILFSKIVKVHCDEKSLTAYEVCATVDSKYINPTMHKEIGLCNPIKFSKENEGLLEKIIEFDRILGAYSFSKNIDALRFFYGEHEESVCYPSMVCLSFLSELMPKFKFPKKIKEIIPDQLPNAKTVQILLKKDGGGDELKNLITTIKMLKDLSYLKGNPESFNNLLEFIQKELKLNLSEEQRGNWKKYLEGFKKFEDVVNFELTNERLVKVPFKILVMISRYSRKAKNYDDSVIAKNFLLEVHLEKAELNALSLVYGYYLGYSNLFGRDGDRSNNMNFDLLPFRFRNKLDDDNLSNLVSNELFVHIFGKKSYEKYSKSTALKEISILSTDKTIHYNITFSKFFKFMSLNKEEVMKSTYENISNLINMVGNGNHHLENLIYLLLTKFKGIEQEVILSNPKGLKFPEIEKILHELLRDIKSGNRVLTTEEREMIHQFYQTAIYLK
jgi:hypothetical protein